MPMYLPIPEGLEIPETGTFDLVTTFENREGQLYPIAVDGIPFPEMEEQPEAEVKRQASFEISLTRFELLHLRDLMGVLLPPDGSQTLSQALASAEDRNLIETMLWNKVSRLCISAGLPVESEAPDYVITPTAPPPMGVFQINQDLQSSRSLSGGFLPEEEESEEGE